MFGDLGLPGADVQARVIGRGAALTERRDSECLLRMVRRLRSSFKSHAVSPRVEQSHTSTQRVWRDMDAQSWAGERSRNRRLDPHGQLRTFQ